MMRSLLLAILNELKRLGSKLESKLKGEVRISSTRKELAPVIGYDACLQEEKGRALICYLTEPFHIPPDSPEMYRHHNSARAIEIARTFNRLGYIADIVNLFDREFVPKNNYDILFGTNPSFARIAGILEDSVVKVYFATEPHPTHRRKAEEKRRDAIKERKGVELALKYPAEKNFPSELTDALIQIGNSWVASTYQPFNKNVYSVGDGGFDFLRSTIEDKDFVKARRNFIWMGNWLLVLKGLDLVLEVFSQLPELNLYVCGALWNEPDFVEAYEQELFHTPNIQVMGRMKLESEEFKKLTQMVAYTIFPTSSDAAAGGVWAPMRCGVIPIVSSENGMEIGDFGFMLPDCKLETIRTAVLEAATKTPEDCRNMALRACEEANRKYTMEAWRKRFEMALRKILYEHGMNRR